MAADGSVLIDVNGDTKNAESALGKLGNIAGGALKGIGTAVAGAATAISALSVASLKASGELEQNIGGSEAVFQQFAKTVQDKGVNAYKEMGLAQSDFLATANKMGALMQGSGLSIEQSADLSTAAMQRAADVASIMGIDVGFAMESITGAAKGNFTMMDNLGVAMNATTLESYALSKGINTSWNEMDNATKVGLAMEMFLEKTEYAAGNYAKENETLAGSLTTAKAALTNFLSGAGGPDQLAESFANAGKVIAKNLIEILPRLTQGLSQVAQQLAPQIGEMLTAVLPALLEGATGLLNGLIPVLPVLIQSLLPPLIEGVTSLFSALVAAFPEILQALVAALPLIIDALMQVVPLLIAAAPLILQALVDGLVTALPTLAAQLPTLIQGIVDAILTGLPIIIDAGVTLLVALVENLPAIITGIVAVIPDLIESIIDAVIDLIPQIIDAGIVLLVALVENLPAIIKGLTEAVPKMIDAITGKLDELIPMITEAGVALFVALIENLPQIILEIVAAVPDIVDGIVNSFMGLLGELIDVGGELLKGVWQGISDAGQWLWDKISGFFSGIVDRIKNFFGIHSPSKLMADMIGGNMALGIGVGFEDETGPVRKDIERSLKDLSNLSVPRLPFAGIGSLALAGAGASSGNYGSEVIGKHGTQIGNLTINPNAQQWSELMKLLSDAKTSQIRGRAR